MEQVLKECNGWPNYPTWAVYGWLSNDQEMYNLMRSNAAIAGGGAPGHHCVRDGIWTEEEAARYTLADAIQDFVEGGNPIHEASCYLDLVTFSLSWVDWNCIADAFLGE